MSDESAGRWSESRGSRRRRTYLEQSVEHRLKVPADVAAAFVTNADFRDGLGEAKVTQKDMDALAALRAAALEVDAAQAKLAKAAGVASKKAEAAVEDAETEFEEVAWRGTAAGRTDPEVRAALKVGRRARARTARLAQMAEYLDAAEGQRAALDGYGLEDGHLTAARETLGVAVAANTAWAVAKKTAEDATKLVAKAMKPLDKKMRDLQERGRGGMGDRPDLLEILGLPPG